MHINHTVTRMSSDWVAMRLIVNRMTDRCLWQYYLPLWSVIIHFSTNNSKRKFTLNESENFNSIWKTRWISQESVRNRCHFPTCNVNISVAISYHYLPTTISFLIWSRKCNYRPQRSWGKVIFSPASVILSTGGCLLPGGVPAPWGGGACCGGCLVETPSGTATAAGGTHPTGLHSCYQYFSKWVIIPKWVISNIMLPHRLSVRVCYFVLRTRRRICSTNGNKINKKSMDELRQVMNIYSPVKPSHNCSHSCSNFGVCLHQF